MAVNAAIIGLGWWGRHLLKQMQPSPALNFVVAVGSREPHRAVAEEFEIPFTLDFESVLKDARIDMVVITTPHAFHANQVMQAASYRKHVFCEKPLSLTLADARACALACRSAGVRLGIGHERRFEAALRAASALVRRGELGKIMHAEGSFSHDKLANLSNENWRLKEAAYVPLPLSGTGIHMTDLFADLLGGITEVYASSPLRDSNEACKTLSLHLRFGSGSTGYVNSTLETPLYMRIAFFGTSGWVEVRNLDHPDSRGASVMTVRMSDGSEHTSWFEWNDSVRENLEAFCRTITANEVYPVSDAQMVANIAVMEAVSQSLRVNRPVRPEE
ncbi:oxidoreductase [Caballeronia sordidicola]|uniref:Oxidoreductase n=1 Tax=Caballeronia sordidicola TaxID=196367 RepID=A0A158GVW4_CABSO|nr:Gfo/Idh/MocA family oxidoreductase [Caballeronia sordidicola]SAL36218.1 oxidoreductase [Caballeronia sordidicola]